MYKQEIEGIDDIVSELQYIKEFLEDMSYSLDDISKALIGKNKEKEENE